MYELGLGVETPHGVISITPEEAKSFSDGYVSKFIEFGQLSAQEQYDRFMSYIKDRLNPMIIRCSNVYGNSEHAQYPLTLEFMDLLREKGFHIEGEPVVIDMFDKKYVHEYLIADDKIKKIKLEPFNHL